MKIKTLNRILRIMIVLLIGILIGVVINTYRSISQIPDRTSIELHTTHLHWHRSGQYRVMIKVDGEHRGSMMLSRNELRNGVILNTEGIQVDL